MSLSRAGAAKHVVALFTYILTGKLFGRNHLEDNCVCHIVLRTYFCKLTQGDLFGDLYSLYIFLNLENCRR